MKARSFVSAAVLLAAVLGDAHATEITLDFTSLPSTQGWTYFTGGAAEADVFSITGGVLSMNAPTTDVAYYKLEGVVDPALPFRLTTRARVVNGGGLGLAFYVATAAQFAGINLSSTRIVDETSWGFLASLDGTTFHDYRIEGAFGAGVKLFVDNTLIASGSFAAYPINMVAFGDSCPICSGHAEITSFSFQQPIPEPETLVLLTAGLGVMVIRFGSRVKGNA